MNIHEAKRQIENAVTAYLTRDDYGEYVIPVEQQRPIFLLGAPGIGKTAIMRQIAQEKHIGLVSYAMTHHTRQSALGLPVIRRKRCGDEEVDVSEYTMSEIIAAIWDTMERTGLKEGILFLDEINCVSETLMPSMLQFLQFKTFGGHRVPEGWVVVTAGNPPEYNRSVRTFDVVTLDRLKVIPVEPDYESWRRYAVARQLHPAVLAYLENRKANLWRMETTADGARFVTPRGWEDLAVMLRLYEQRSLTVDVDLIRQYLQDDKVAADFGAYWELFRKYQDDYAIGDILAGKADETILQRANQARIDERIALLGLLLDRLSGELADVTLREDALTEVLNALKEIKGNMGDGVMAPALLAEQTELARERLTKGRGAGTLTAQQQHVQAEALRLLEEFAGALTAEAVEEENAFPFLRDRLAGQIKEAGEQAEGAEHSLDNLFAFADRAFPDGQEVVLLVTEMTVNPSVAEFISRHGSESYFAHSKNLLFQQRGKEIERRVKTLDLDQIVV